MREHALATVAPALLMLGGLLEVAGIGFFGLDGLVTLCFAGAVATGLFSRRPLGVTGAVFGLAALVLHLGLVLLS